MSKLIPKIPPLAASVIILALASPAPTQATNTGRAALSGQSLTDEQFSRKATLCGIVEIKLGKLVQERAVRADVKKHAQYIVEDYTRANEDLLRLAKKKGMLLSTELDKEHQEKCDKFQKLQGLEFDQAYIKCQLEDHAKAVAMFETHSRTGQDADLKAFVERTLPTLKKHLEMAGELARRNRKGE